MELKSRVAASLAAAVVMTFAGAGAAQAATGAGPAQVVRLAHARPTPEGRKHCEDIDSAGDEYYAAHALYVSAVCDGKVYVLTIDPTTTPPTAVGGWQAVGGPTDVVDATLAAGTQDVLGGPVFVTALTRSGAVWQGVCANTRPLGACSFRQLPQTPH
ncbi:hypothetical protein [Streptomyces naganishii]|uniref:Secreted protein n=1 Tax=Streptomyces naganishii JCM 4654 TaxID=1306179 RepID=A0A918YA47_9ACTN|nr:hypothetical protein [Streptomyces naganishii]GHD95973.1 hypothetical protein GCM10010508_62880 [Streptomyces naganishii JCM 4654]